MNDSTSYTPPKVWVWNKESGGRTQLVAAGHDRGHDVAAVIVANCGCDGAVVGAHQLNERTHLGRTANVSDCAGDDGRGLQGEDLPSTCNHDQ